MRVAAEDHGHGSVPDVSIRVMLTIVLICASLGSFTRRTQHGNHLNQGYRRLRQLRGLPRRTRIETRRQRGTHPGGLWRQPRHARHRRLGRRSRLYRHLPGPVLAHGAGCRTDRSEAEWKKAFELFGKFDQPKGIEDLKATLAVARTLPGANGRAATMGYCLGGRLAFMMAEQSDADVNISYYGVGLDDLLGDIHKITKPLLVHIADKDEFFPADARAKTVAGTKGHPHISCYNYAADHAFARVDGTHWHGLSATIANGRSAAALVAALG